MKLHPKASNRPASRMETNNKKENKQESPRTSGVSSHIGRQEESVIIATALIRVLSTTGNHELLRVLIDPGSQASFITERSAQLLGNPRQKIRAEVSGLGDSTPKISNAKIEAQISPRFPSEFSTHVSLLILPKLTQSLPKNSFDTNMSLWQNQILADPTFNKSGPIDIILGAHVYGKILLQGLIKSENGLIAQNTELGWILSGSINYSDNNHIQIQSMMTRTEEDKQLTKFWEVEDVTNPQISSEHDENCEQFYSKTTKRNKNGSYTVQTPFKEKHEDMGTSKPRAFSRFLQLEKRLLKDPELHQDYQNFIQEYIDLGHMKKVPQNKIKEAMYYIPHQPVIRESSTTTKLRVVFDASCKTSKGISLNDTMFTGPRLQQELVDILLRWRKHKIVFSADIEKMYRQIHLHTDDQKFYRILWRFNTKLPIQEYELATVTYGTASAPYLAIRTLQQLAKDEKANYPLAAATTLTDFYVDDLLSGANSSQQAITLQTELIQLMRSGGFTLRKWSSNNSQLLANLPDELKDTSSLEINQDDTKKSLGVHWAPFNDTFRFKVTLSDSSQWTKRQILSEVAKIFDPLGWLSPIIVKAKMLIKELWLLNLEWDQPVPDSILTRWLSFRDQLPAVESIYIPRWFGYDPEQNTTELHGFCDASEKAYGAVIYAKTIDKLGKEGKITLLIAKSKVAPAKGMTTIPRLELCAALLLARLIKKTVSALGVDATAVHAWTDSMIALAWINGNPNKWKLPLNNLNIGDLVLLRAEVNPSKWPLARISEVHPGKDGMVRVVSMKKSGGTTVKRTIQHVIPLPKCEEKQDTTIPIKVAANATTCKKTIAVPKPFKTIKKWSILLLLLLTSTVKSTSQFTVHKPPPGMYVEHIGHARIDRGCFRIEVRYERAKINQDVVAADSVVAQMSQLCNNTKMLTDNTPCTNFIDHLIKLKNQVSRVTNSILEISTRQKRGLLGQLLTSVFGVNDEAYHDIETLDKNQQELIKSSNHQTKLMLSTISTVKETEERINMQLQYFQTKINETINVINKMSRWYHSIDDNKLSIHFLASYELAKSFLNEILYQYRLLQKIQINQGNFFELIDHYHINAIISSAATKLPSPIEIHASPILKSTFNTSKDYIHVYGYFPITEKSDFLLLKITPVPLEITNLSYWIFDVTTDVLAVDYNTQLYFQIKDTTLKKSIVLNPDRYLCSPSVVRNIENSQNCIIDTIYQRSEKTTRPIKTVKMSAPIIWKQIYAENSWMYITKTPVKVALVCNGNRQDITLNTAGIIHISQDCILKTKSNILSPKQMQTVRVLEGFAKHVPIQINSSWHHLHQDSINLIEEPIIGISEEFGRIKMEEENLQADLGTTSWKKIGHHHTLANIITGAVVILIILILWVIRHLWIRRESRHQPKPNRPSPKRPKLWPRRRVNTNASLQSNRVEPDAAKIDMVELQPIYTQPKE